MVMRLPHLASVEGLKLHPLPPLQQVLPLDEVTATQVTSVLAEGFGTKSKQKEALSVSAKSIVTRMQSSAVAVVTIKAPAAASLSAIVFVILNMLEILIGWFEKILRLGFRGERNLLFCGSCHSLFRFLQHFQSKKISALRVESREDYEYLR
jgi:hypothetical protein